MLLEIGGAAGPLWAIFGVAGSGGRWQVDVCHTSTQQQQQQQHAIKVDVFAPICAICVCGCLGICAVARQCCSMWTCAATAIVEATLRDVCVALPELEVGASAWARELFLLLMFVAMQAAQALPNHPVTSYFACWQEHFLFHLSL